MESLLSSAFDLLSSNDPVHIRKGLRHLEGILAKMCLSPASLRGAKIPARKPDDPAYREFVKLQNGFEWNATIRLISCLERLLGQSSNAQINQLILSCLDLIQGTLLLHPQSRQLFARETNMTALLDLLDAGNDGAVQCAALLTLVCGLLDKPQNIRTFEALEGLPTVTCLFKRRDTPREVKLKCLEFLYFYLMPETSPTETKSSAPQGRMRRASSVGSRGRVRTTEEKQKLLGEWLNNVEDLVADLNEGGPFGI